MSISGRPFFSIVIPTYNRASLLEKTLQSIQPQTYPHFEVLVIDDGGTDSSREVVRAMEDPRILYYYKANEERGAARNYGARLAKGDYFNFFDSDDLMYPIHLEEAANMISRFQCPEFFHLAYDHRKENGELMSEVVHQESKVASSVLFNNDLSCNGVFLRSDIARTYPFREDRELASAEDWELWIRLLCRYPIKCSQRVTSSVIHHEQRSITTIKPEKVINRDLLMIRLLSQDAVVMGCYNGLFKRFKAERYTYIMLSLAQARQRIEVIRWALIALRTFPKILFTKRFLASVRNIIKR